MKNLLLLLVLLTSFTINAKDVLEVESIIYFDKNRKITDVDSNPQTGMIFNFEDQKMIMTMQTEIIFVFEYDHSEKRDNTLFFKGIYKLINNKQEECVASINVDGKIYLTILFKNEMIIFVMKNE